MKTLDAADCVCYHTCAEDAEPGDPEVDSPWYFGPGCTKSGRWHAHEDEPCPVHPDADL